MTDLQEARQMLEAGQDSKWLQEFLESTSYSERIELRKGLTKAPRVLYFDADAQVWIS